MKRRADDPDDLNPAELRGGQIEIFRLLKYGLSTFLVLYLLGVFSFLGLKPPYFDFKTALDAHENQQQDRHIEAILLQRGICLGVWQNAPQQQNTYCNRPLAGR